MMLSLPLSSFTGSLLCVTGSFEEVLSEVITVGGVVIVLALERGLLELLLPLPATAGGTRNDMVG